MTFKTHHSENFLEHLDSETKDPAEKRSLQERIRDNITPAGRNYHPR